jgi:cephalosporin hydroxylase
MYENACTWEGHDMRTLLIAIVGLVALVLLPPLRASAEQQIQLLSGPLTPAQRELIHHFSRMLALRKDGIWANRYLGVSTLQNPFDVWVTQEILFEVKPDFVVEAGTYHGGSALLWATLLAPIKPEARVITIDIKDRRKPGAKSHPLAKEKVDFLLGSSTGPKIVAAVSERVKGKSVVVILDSSHATEHVRRELDLYAPFVPVGSYLIVQDTGVGPGEAIRDFLSTRDDFVVDHKRERLLVTNNRGGFLKRIK